MDFVTAAHDYSSRGWRVIELHRVGPDGRTCSCGKGGNCSSAGKHPKAVAWQEAPRLSAADIQATWDVDKAPNIGLATGRESGFWVLDIDPKGGGMESMAALVAEHGPLPTTFVVQTGSGGYHYYFALPDFDLRNSSNRVGAGIDTRADGGQVVAAPSITDKGVYTVVSDEPPAAAPEWLLELARKQVDPSTVVTAKDLPKPEDIDEATWRRLSAYAQRAIDSELERLAKLAATGWDGEPWNHTTFEVSCSLIEFANSPWCAYSLDQARRDVLERTPRDNAGFDDYTVTKTFNSALEKVGSKARPMPEDRRAEPDPMFTGPDVQGPTEGGGSEANPAVGRRPFRTLFGGENGTTPLYAEMAAAVNDFGPVGWGRDEDFWSYEGGVWRPDEHVVQYRLVRLLGNAYKVGHKSNVEDIVQTHAMRLRCDPHPDLMNFRNGMLDWRTGEITDHSPEHGSTVQFPLDWTPEATCPNFDAFLADVMHEDYVALAWEMIGYLMLSGNPLQVAFLFYGSGGNGKGTLMRVIEALLGRENIATESLDDLNQNRFSAVNLFGKIANLAGDIDGTYQESTANFKKLTGEDTYPGERKFGQRFTFQSWAVPVFSANKIPGSADVTEGYLRRWIVLHFHKRITNVVPGFSDLLEKELPGIAAKAVAALRPLMFRKGFDPRGEAVKGKEEFHLAIDQVKQWEKHASQPAPEAWTSLMDVYRGYSSWARESGQHAVREAEFALRLASYGYEMETRDGVQGVIGIKAPAPVAMTPSGFWE